MTDPTTYVSTWEKVAAISTAVGGVGAMLGAIFAWRAARTSGQTARDARDALGASLKPQVNLVFAQESQKGPVVARAVVVGPLSPVGLAGVLPAADVLIQFNSAIGKHDSASLPILEPNRSSWAQEPPYLSVVIGQPTEEWPPAEGDYVTATVSFSDVRRATRYQQSRSVDLRRSDAPGVVSFQNLTEPTETRIEP